MLWDRDRRWIGGLALLFCGLRASMAIGLERDITSLLNANPSIASAVGGLCDRLCAGNEKRSWLERATLEIGLSGVSVAAMVSLESRHVPMRGVVLYDDTAHVDVVADLALASCAVQNVRITANNDIYRLLIDAFRAQLQDILLRAVPGCASK